MTVKTNNQTFLLPYIYSMLPYSQCTIEGWGTRTPTAKNYYQCAVLVSPTAAVGVCYNRQTSTIVST